MFTYSRVFAMLQELGKIVVTRNVVAEHSINL